MQYKKQSNRNSEKKSKGWCFPLSTAGNVAEEVIKIGYHGKEMEPTVGFRWGPLVENEWEKCAVEI